MKKIILIVAIFANLGSTKNVQNSNNDFNCEEVTFWQSKLISIIKSIPQSATDFDEKFNSERIPKGFDSCYVKKSVYVTETENSFDEYIVAKGKENVKEKGSGFKAEKKIKSKIDAQKYYDSIFETFKQCLKSQEYSIDTGTNGVELSKIIEENKKLISTYINLAIVPINASNVMGKYPIGYIVVLEWDYREYYFF